LLVRPVPAPATSRTRCRRRGFLQGLRRVRSGVHGLRVAYRLPVVVRAWLPVVAYVLAIVAVSSMPAGALPGGGLWRIDKLIHAGEYGGRGALVYRGFVLATELSRRRGAAVACALAAAVGAADELFQSLSPGRFPSAGDALADAIGAAFGVALAWALY